MAWAFEGKPLRTGDLGSGLRIRRDAVGGEEPSNGDNTQRHFTIAVPGEGALGVQACSAWIQTRLQLFPLLYGHVAL